MGDIAIFVKNKPSNLKENLGRNINFI